MSRSTRMFLIFGLLAALAMTWTLEHSLPASGRSDTPPLLVAVTGAHHQGFDRIVFRFQGGLPVRHQAAWVSRLIEDPSARALPVAGREILRLTFYPAAAHSGAGRLTAPARTAFAMPNAMALVRAGDFESVTSYGIGVAQRAAVHVSTLRRPDRVVVDIRSTLATVLRPVYLFNRPAFDAGHGSYVTRVLRPVPRMTPATGLLDRLFAGPTPAEYASGLRFLSSRATGFSSLSVSAGVARVRLTGGCSSGGSTASIADEIFPTLHRLAGVRAVKILDPRGHTEEPSGIRDSRPACLEP